MRALVHPPSRRMNDCELTYVRRAPIDCDLTEQQHSAYCELLHECGLEVIRLTGNKDLPDCAFVEDAAIVLGEVVVIASMGVETRRRELPMVEACLAGFCKTVRISPPATIDGGDVLQVGDTLLVGRSSRTNDEGIAALRAIAEPLGWHVKPVAVNGCLHLKTACTAIDDQRLLVQRAWIDADDLEGFHLLDAPATEPWSANVLRIGETLCVPEAHQLTARLLTTHGYHVRTTDISELAKAEAGMTCLSVLF